MKNVIRINYIFWKEGPLLLGLLSKTENDSRTSNFKLRS